MRGVTVFAKDFSGLPARKISKTNVNHFNAFGCLDLYMDTFRFASYLDLLVLGYDCTCISGHKVEGISSGHNGLFALLLLIVLACLKHFESDRFCKRRFDLFAISICCFTIVSDFLLFIYELLDQATDADGHKRPVYADSAYRSKEQEQRLANAEIASQVCEKGTRGKPLSEDQKVSNRTKSKVRARVEHVFGVQAAMGGHWLRSIGLQRVTIKIGLLNLVYNMKRFIQLIKRDSEVGKPDLISPHSKITPVMT